MGSILGSDKSVFTGNLRSEDEPKSQGFFIVAAEKPESALTDQENQEKPQVEKKPTFVDYRRAGWQLGLTLAIDYTQSNANPDPSLHHFYGNNPYEQAIEKVGTIIEPYDQSKQFSTLGFGGVPTYMGQSDSNHCFPVNGNEADPRIRTIQHVLETYLDKLP